MDIYTPNSIKNHPLGLYRPTNNTAPEIELGVYIHMWDRGYGVLEGDTHMYIRHTIWIYIHRVQFKKSGPQAI